MEKKGTACFQTGKFSYSGSPGRGEKKDRGGPGILLSYRLEPHATTAARTATNMKQGGGDLWHNKTLVPRESKAKKGASGIWGCSLGGGGFRQKQTSSCCKKKLCKDLEKRLGGEVREKFGRGPRFDEGDTLFGKEDTKEANWDPKKRGFERRIELHLQALFQKKKGG